VQPVHRGTINEMLTFLLQLQKKLQLRINLRQIYGRGCLQLEKKKLWHFCTNDYASSISFKIPIWKGSSVLSIRRQCIQTINHLVCINNYCPHSRNHLPLSWYSVFPLQWVKVFESLKQKNLCKKKNKNVSGMVKHALTSVGWKIWASGYAVVTLK
jgi:hypothetical protein